MLSEWFLRFAVIENRQLLGSRPRMMPTSQESGPLSGCKDCAIACDSTWFNTFELKPLDCEFVVLLIFLDIWWDLLIFASWGFSRPSTDTTTTPLPIVRSRSHWKLSPHWFQASQINGRWTRLTCGCNRCNKTSQNQSYKSACTRTFLHKKICTRNNF